MDIIKTGIGLQYPFFFVKGNKGDFLGTKYRQSSAKENNNKLLIKKLNCKII